MKRLRITKQYGEWFYKKINPDDYSELDAPVYELYNSEKQFVGTFGMYRQMKDAIEYGNIDEYLRIYG